MDSIHTMTNAIWFSRHAPTTAQLEEITAGGSELVALAEGTALGARSLTSEEDVDLLIYQLRELARINNAREIYGVFPTPVLRTLSDDGKELGYLQGREECYAASQFAYCYASWNVQRSVEGGKPTFEHLKWCGVGVLDLATEETVG